MYATLARSNRLERSSPCRYLSVTARRATGGGSPGSISGTARELPAPLDALRRLDERILHLLSHERLAEFLLQPYHITQAYREQLLADLRTVEPEATLHFIWELTKLRLPRNSGQVAILIVAGQKEAFVTQQAAYAMSRAVPFARGALVPGAGHFWNLESPDLFTQMVRVWIEDEVLPSRLLRV